MIKFIEHKLKDTNNINVSDNINFKENGYLKTDYYIPNILQNKIITSNDVPTTKAIIDKDDRAVIENTNIFPFSTIVQITISFPSKNSYLGSGVVISKHHILTVGHNLYKYKQGTWANNLIIIPGKSNKIEPFERFSAISIYINEQFIKEEITQNDIGLVRIFENIGEITGYVGLALLSPNNTISIIGYPQDRNKGTCQYRSVGIIESIKNNVINYKLDTSWGQSGSGIFLKEHSDYYVSGVHSRSTNNNYNEGLQLTNETINSLKYIINI